ncbi:hypothetical protein ACCC88_20990 [Sphingomonas sp. Sphisp140]|uniref:hypothetical protein n=1 Tax=unclassified Sphingomonas TaxID=196159 RepID=UPI0039AF7FE8
MTPLHLILPVAALLSASAVPMQQSWQRYTQPTNLSAELPGAPERVDVRNEAIKSRVIQLNHTGRDANGDFRSFYFLQVVIADHPFDVDAKIAADIAEAKGGGDAAVGKTFVSQRALKPSEMPLPGMRGTELVYTYSGFGSDGNQIETSRNMYVGNKWLSVSVRHFEKDRSWPKDRFFNSVTWRP